MKSDADIKYLPWNIPVQLYCFRHSKINAYVRSMKERRIDSVCKPLVMQSFTILRDKPFVSFVSLFLTEFLLLSLSFLGVFFVSVMLPFSMECISMPKP